MKLASEKLEYDKLALSNIAKSKIGGSICTPKPLLKLNSCAPRKSRYEKSLIALVIFNLESSSAIDDSNSNCKSCKACCSSKICANESPESSLSISSIVSMMEFIES